jgi:hypothetical protein
MDGFRAIYCIIKYNFFAWLFNSIRGEFKPLQLSESSIDCRLNVIDQILYD